MAASVNELSVDEQEREQGAESGLPTGAVYVFDADPRTLQQEILLEAESHELLHATLTTDGASEFRIEGLPEGDTRSEPTGFDGTLSLTIDRIF
jgi:hypothetical protein